MDAMMWVMIVLGGWVFDVVYKEVYPTETICEGKCIHG